MTIENSKLNGYVVFYNGKRLEIYAATSYAAHQEAAKQLKVSPKKEHMISVCLCERAGEQVVHSADF